MDPAATAPLRVIEAAALLRERGLPASERLIRDACASGELAALKLKRGRRWFIPRAEVLRWAQSAFLRNTEAAGISESELTRHHAAEREFKSRYGGD
jgi:hypothetical protein